MTVTNADPVAGTITAPSTAGARERRRFRQRPVHGRGHADTHTTVWDWGDGSTSAGTVADHSAAGTHRYSARASTRSP